MQIQTTILLVMLMILQLILSHISISIFLCGTQIQESNQEMLVISVSN